MSNRPVPGAKGGIANLAELRAKRTQGTGGGPRREFVRPLFVGLDFGTSWTKAAVRDPASDRTFLLRIGGTADPMLPSVVNVDVDGRLSVGDRSKVSGTRVQFLKMLLAGAELRDSGLEAVLQRSEIARLMCSARGGHGPLIEALSTYYLAYALTSIRIAISARGFSTSDTFVVSMGAPVVVADSKRLDLFRRVLSAAYRWMLRGSIPSSLDDALEQWRVEASLAPEPDCHVRPELEAAYEPLVRLRSARQDVAVLVDVGGGTVEVVAAQYARVRESDKLNAYSGDFKNIGVQVVAEHIKEATLALRVNRVMTSPGVPRVLASSSAGKALRAQFCRLVGGVVSQGCRRGGLEWNDHKRGPIAVFLTGGGAKAPVYEMWLEDIWKRQLFGLNIRSHVIKALPVPEDVDRGDITGDVFHRFSIAYGLSVLASSLDVSLPAQFVADEGWRSSGLGSRNRAFHGIDYADSKDALD